MFKQGLGGALFHHMAALHHHHPVGKTVHQVQVVSDHQHGHAVAALQIGQQVQNLAAQTDIQGSRGFVRQ